MNKTVSAALIAAVVLLGGATGVLYAKYRKSTTSYTELQAAEEASRQRYAQTIEAIAEIQDSLNAIAVSDADVKMQSGDLQTEQQITSTTNQEALDRIAEVRAGIERSKVRIRQLESSLQKSGIKNAGLERMVANLKQSVAEKEQLVAELSTAVDTLQTQVAGLQTEVSGLQTEVQTNQQTIEEKRRELATVYVALGSKKDLTESGVLEAKGGVLGMGKTLKPTGKFDEMTFKPLDTDQQTVVEIPSGKAQVVSPQPPTSYELREVGEKRLELHIINPAEFRKVRQLVIVTA